MLYYAGAVLAAILLIVILAAWWHEAREQRRQRRLAGAFERARRVSLTGTGEQGKPYSIYTEGTWLH